MSSFKKKYTKPNIVISVYMSSDSQQMPALRWQSAEGYARVEIQL